MSEVKRKILAFLNGAAPQLRNYVLRRVTAPSDAEINKNLAEKYGEIAEEMKKGGRKTKETGAKAEPGIAPAKVYRRRIESSEAPCGICIEMLRRLEEKPTDLQLMGVPQIAEAEGASRSGAGVDELKEIMSKSDVLRDILMEMKGGKVDE